jgi:hypothetical protein
VRSDGRWTRRMEWFAAVQTCASMHLLISRSERVLTGLWLACLCCYAAVACGPLDAPQHSTGAQKCQDEEYMYSDGSDDPSITCPIECDAGYTAVETEATYTCGLTADGQGEWSGSLQCKRTRACTFTMMLILIPRVGMLQRFLVVNFCRLHMRHLVTAQLGTQQATSTWMNAQPIAIPLATPGQCPTVAESSKFVSLTNASQ